MSSLGLRRGGSHSTQHQHITWFIRKPVDGEPQREWSRSIGGAQWTRFPKQLCPRVTPAALESRDVEAARPGTTFPLLGQPIFYKASILTMWVEGVP